MPARMIARTATRLCHRQSSVLCSTTPLSTSSFLHSTASARLTTTTTTTTTITNQRHFTTSPQPSMRLPYIDDEPTMATAEEQAVVERVKERRGGKLIALDKALLHAPAVADGWNGFLGAIRTRTSLPPSLRELAICRVAALNSAWYEWDSHAPLLLAAGVLAPATVERVKERAWTGEGEGQERAGAGADSGWDEKHRAVLAYTDAMTLGCIVREPVFARLKRLFSDREVVEITATVAAYNTVSRFLVALDVGEMAAKYGVDMS